MKNKKAIDLCNGPLFGKIIIFTIPIILSGVLQLLFNAVDMVRLASEIVGGKGGGGRPDMAQAGGSDTSKMNDVLSAVQNYLKG